MYILYTYMCVCVHTCGYGPIYAIVCVWSEDNLSVGPCLLPTLRLGLLLFVGMLHVPDDLAFESPWILRSSPLIRL